MPIDYIWTPAYKLTNILSNKTELAKGNANTLRQYRLALKYKSLSRSFFDKNFNVKLVKAYSGFRKIKQTSPHCFIKAHLEKYDP